ncbi:MAG: right-handed parallel beta-helix repeat-containing protein, partial [Actinomycetota bacterium]|nr:right-handed parallel beta-helix repeat-containing protein [Actinomycetota bacterium]
LVYDNVGIVSFGNGSTAARNDHNVSGADVSFVGPLTTYSGFRLTSPKGTASDSIDVGIR